MKNNLENYKKNYINKVLKSHLKEKAFFFIKTLFFEAS